MDEAEFRNKEAKDMSNPTEPKDELAFQRPGANKMTPGDLAECIVEKIWAIPIFQATLRGAYADPKNNSYAKELKKDMEAVAMLEILQAITGVK